MNKQKIIDGASEILGNAERNLLAEYLENVLNENYGLQLTDEQWIYGLLAYYGFVAGDFEIWKEYQVKFNQALLGVAK